VVLLRSGDGTLSFLGTGTKRVFSVSRPKLRSPDTVLQSQQLRFRGHWTKLPGRPTGGRSPVNREIRALFPPRSCRFSCRRALSDPLAPCLGVGATLWATVVLVVPAAVADVVTDWNEVALNAIRATGTNPLRASRALAMLHIAIYDAVNAIDRTHEPYLSLLPVSPDASKRAAVAAAAHTMLTNLSPTSAATIDAALAATLAGIPVGLPRANGLALGSASGASILPARVNDGSTLVVPYAPGSDPGDWRPTPPAFAPALLPNWPEVTPFAMTSGSQFRQGRRLALDSPAYPAAFEEVTSLGSATSSARTQGRTNIARFRADGAGTFTPPGHWNAIAQVVAEERGRSVSDSARLFALLNIGLADAAIAAWDMKYVYNYWRPVTAIRDADADGNLDTEVNPLCAPLIITPAFPSYTSGHSTFSVTAAAILADFFGDDSIAFTNDPDPMAMGVPSRHFDAFSEAAADAG
jgi:hypothetical protein